MWYTFQVGRCTGSTRAKFATELQATGALSGKEAIAANAALSKAMDGEMLTAADIKSLHAEIPAVRAVLSSKLGTQLETGSSDEVRNAITQYVKKGNSARRRRKGRPRQGTSSRTPFPMPRRPSTRKPAQRWRTSGRMQRTPLRHSMRRKILLFSNVHLDGMMGEELLGKENRTRTYEETQLPSTNRATFFHRLVIARTGCTAQKRQSIRTTAFQ